MTDKLLSVELEGREICSFDAEFSHGEHSPVVEVRTAQPTLCFIDSRGTRRTFDLSFVREENASWLHFSIRVSPEFLVQSDFLMTITQADSEEAFRARAVDGVRVQPFVLPECAKRYDVIEGKGLFRRGFHFKGIITPGNVTLLCRCAYCERSFRVRSVHAGMGNAVYFYCGSCSHTLMASADLEDAPPVIGPAYEEELKRFEQRLPPCEACGGSFSYYNPFLCPHCKEPYIDFGKYPKERDWEYYCNVYHGRWAQNFAEGD